MHITDQQLAQLRADSFLIVPSFLSPAETEAAREGFYSCYSPRYEQWIAAGKPERNRANHLFPYDSPGLNHAATHPDLIDAAERILGTPRIRLTEAHLGIKYYGEEHWQGYHIDFGNNTLGPAPAPDDFNHLAVFYCFDEVTADMSPIMMVPKGRPDSESIPMLCPAGSICFYGMGTRHSASPWTGGPGQRPTAWLGFTRLDRPWDAARTFTYKSGARQEPMRQFIESASPRQLELIGFPPVDDPLWTDAFLEGMLQRYPKMDTAPYRAARRA